MDIALPEPRNGLSDEQIANVFRQSAGMFQGHFKMALRLIMQQDELAGQRRLTDPELTQLSSMKGVDDTSRIANRFGSKVIASAMIVGKLVGEFKKSFMEYYLGATLDNGAVVHLKPPRHREEVMLKVDALAKAFGETTTQYIVTRVTRDIVQGKTGTVEIRST